jgi:hypothetical protein
MDLLYFSDPEPVIRELAASRTLICRSVKEFLILSIYIAVSFVKAQSV